MAPNAPVPVFDVIKRRWLFVLAVALVAAAVAGGVTALRDVTYTATATIALDNSALVRVSGLPGGERILVELRTDAYYEDVALASGTDIETVRARLGSYAEGQPIERIRITFADADEVVAKRVATAAGEAAMDVIRNLGSIERERQEKTLAAAEAALAGMRNASGGAASPWEAADTAYKTFVLEDRATTAEYTIGVIDGAHRLEDGISVGRTSVLRSAVTNAVGGAVAGLFIGIGLAYVLERSARAV